MISCFGGNFNKARHDAAAQDGIKQEPAGIQEQGFSGLGETEEKALVTGLDN